MVEIESKIINRLDYSAIKSYNSVIVRQCVIDTIDFGFNRVDLPLIFENCVVKEFLLHTCWFRKGITIQNCIFKNDILYEMGGHNEKEIYIKYNIFHGFFDFFDCHFERKIFIQNNIFIKGTNLLGNKEKGYENLFNNGIEIDGNIGNLQINY